MVVRSLARMVISMQMPRERVDHKRGAGNARLNTTANGMKQTKKSIVRMFVNTINDLKRFIYVSSVVAESQRLSLQLGKKAIDTTADFYAENVRLNIGRSTHIKLEVCRLTKKRKLFASRFVGQVKRIVRHTSYVILAAPIEIVV
jgi:hypothetical protein